MTDLQIYLLLMPVLFVIFALIMVVLINWQDKRDARRQAEKNRLAHRP
jgi:hypothetical protein